MAPGAESSGAGSPGAPSPESRSPGREGHTGARKPPPWWLTWLPVAGLVLVFVGERILATAGPARIVFTGVGAAAVVGSTLWRLVTWRRSVGESRRVERILLLTHLGCVAALLLYALGSDAVLGVLDLDFATAEAGRRFRTALQVAGSLVLALALLPLLGVAWALGTRRTGAEAHEVEALRVRETAAGALSVALAGAALLLLGWTAQERDRTLDLSYFRTASPGSTTEEIVSSLDDPLRVHLFFPPVNEVEDEVSTYFRALADATGRLEIQRHDRLEAPGVARDLGVTADGTVILATGDQEERLDVSTTLASARPTLRRLDGEVQNRLLRLLRGRRTVYMTVGHGELNDPASAGPFEGEREVGVEALRELLGLLGYDVRELGLGSGLGSQVPEDATAVLVLGPRRAFLEGEEETLDRYLARGGSLLLAVDPDTDVSMDLLGGRLGIAVDPVPLADDARFVRRRGNLSDRRLLVTDRFSSHASVSTLTRMGTGAGILLAGTGSLELLDREELPDPEAVRRTFVIRTLPSTFADVDGDFQFDPDREERESRPVAAAVETVEPGEVGESEDEGVQGMRALVYADAELFSDLVLGNVGLNAALVADAVRWLGREEDLAGETVSEEDVPIVHTRGEDVAWFYSTIVGAPALVLGLGLLGVWLRRRHKSRRTA